MVQNDFWRLLLAHTTSLRCLIRKPSPPIYIMFVPGYPNRSVLDRFQPNLANRIAQEENDKALTGIKDSGKTAIYEPTAEEKLAFKKQLVPVHKTMEGRVGKDLIQSIYEATGFKPDSL